MANEKPGTCFVPESAAHTTIIPLKDEPVNQSRVERTAPQTASGIDSDDGISPSRNPDIVDWDGDDDPSNPMNWSKARKWFIIDLVSAIGFNMSMAPTIFAPGAHQAQDEFDNHDATQGSLLVSIFVIGLIIGPLFLSPAGELYGRLIAAHAANVVFTVASILCAVAVSIPMLLVFRLVMGLACSVPLTIGGGVIADLVEREKRGKAINFWNIGPTLGPVAGPVIGGYLSLKVGWRWTYWLLAILNGVLTIAAFILFRETYAPRLLELKTRRLRNQTGNMRLRSRFDKGQTPGALFRTALVRPGKLLIRSPIVMMISLLGALAYSYMYVLFTTFTSVFQGEYGFNVGEAGLAYLGLGIGFLLSQATLSKFSDWYLIRRKAKTGIYRPEDRIPPLVLGTLLLPFGLFWYGWTVQYHTHWIVPMIGTLVCGLGIMSIFMPVQMYLVDAFPLYATSAIAASTVVRSVFGTCVPLAGPALYARLGLGWGTSLLGFLALAFAPCSVVLLVYGERIRNNPRFQPEL